MTSKRKNEDISSDVSKLKELVTLAFDNYKQSKKQDSLHNLQQVTLEIISLKQDNRDFQNNAEQLKTTVTQEKIKLDQLNLQLQNLLYEKNHLKKEILECRDFKRSQQEPQLVSEQEFFQLAPPELTKPENEHQKMINRLTFELQQRKK
jgi:predicted  nucleic acid-binding Zn-ribbon protein